MVLSYVGNINMYFVFSILFQYLIIYHMQLKSFYNQDQNPPIYGCGFDLVLLEYFGVRIRRVKILRQK